VLLPLQQHHEVVVGNACAWINIGIEIKIKTVWSFRDDEWLNIKVKLKEIDRYKTAHLEK